VPPNIDVDSDAKFPFPLALFDFVGARGKALQCSSVESPPLGNFCRAGY
jgi:hypothetical protein